MRRLRYKWMKFWRCVGQGFRDSDVWKKIGIGTLVTAAILGIAQSFGGDAYRLWIKPFFVQFLWPLLEQTSAVQVWQIVAVVVFVLALIIYSILLSASIDVDGRVTATMVAELERMCAPILSALEKSTLDLIAADEIIQQLIKFAILRVENIYGGRIFRGSVWVPDPEDPINWLYLYTDIGLNDVVKRRFYIGSYPDDVTNRPGVAGTVFRSKKPQLVHYDKSGGRADNNAFIAFDGDINRPYASFVVIPLYATFLDLDHVDQGWHDDSKVYGVICLDSAHRDTFDNDPIIDKEGKGLLAAGPLLRVIYQLLRWRTRLSMA